LRGGDVGPHLKLTGMRHGEEVSLPQDLDAIAIETYEGTIYIDLAEQIENHVLVRGIRVDGRAGQVELSKLNSGRLAMGISKQT
jgi:hypothetical protein